MTRTDEEAVARGPSWWRTSKMWWLIGAVAALALLIGVAVEEAGKPAPIPYSTFLDQLEAGNVVSVTFQGTEINGRFKRPLGNASRDTFSSQVPEVGDPALIAELRKQQVVIDAGSPSQWTSLLARIPWPMLVFLGAVMIAALVRLLRGGKAQSGPAAPTLPAHGMMGLVSGLFAKRHEAGSPPAHDGDEPKSR